MIPQAWADLPFWSTDWPHIDATIKADHRIILPPEPLRFAALELTSPDQTRVVILGQDPYPTPGHAMGLAFSVGPQIQRLPPSLRHIFRELQNDLNVTPAHGDLTYLAHQGVLLLNTALTVPAGEAGGHSKLGWSRLAAQIIAHVSQRPTVFLLWGKHAQDMAQHIQPGNHLILKAPHPSPLSAYRGFFGSRPFSQTNDWFVARHELPIVWAARH